LKVKLGLSYISHVNHNFVNSQEKVLNDTNWNIQISHLYFSTSYHIISLP